MTRTNSRTCPTCGSKTIPIVYGMPGDPKVLEMADCGEKKLGGCVIWFDNPSLVCRGSDPHYWREGTGGSLITISGD